MAEKTNQASEDNVEKAIKKHKEFLEERIDPDSGLLDILLANGTLSRKECSKVKGQSSLYERNSVLLDCILEKHQSDRLITALKESEQAHIVNYLSANGEYKKEFGGDWPLTSKEISILDENQRALVELLEVSELLGLLYSSKVINRRQMVVVSYERSPDQQNEILVEILRRRSLRDYRQTIKCLHQSHQSHAAKILEEGGVVVRVHTNLDDDFDDEKDKSLGVKPGFKSQDAECQTDAQLGEQSTDVPSKLEEACQTEENVNPSDTGRTINEKTEAQHQIFTQPVLESTGTQTDFEMVGVLVKTNAEFQYDVGIDVSSFSQSLLEQEHATNFAVETLSKDFNYKEALRNCLFMFSDCLDVKHGLLDHLLSKNVFNKREQEAVEAETTESKQIGKVIDLMSRKSVDQFKKFLEALVCTCQFHVVNLIICYGDISKLVGDLRPLGKDELQWIDRDELDIVNMDCCVDTSLLLDRLLQVGGLTRRQFESINQSSQKTRSLMNIVRKGSLVSFKRFLACLMKPHRNCIAELVEPNSDLGTIKALTNGDSEEDNLNNLKQMELVSRELNIWKRECALLKHERDLAKYEAYLLRQQLEAVEKTDHMSYLQN